MVLETWGYTLKWCRPLVVAMRSKLGVSCHEFGNLKRDVLARAATSINIGRICVVGGEERFHATPQQER